LGVERMVVAVCKICKKKIREHDNPLGLKSITFSMIYHLIKDHDFSGFQAQVEYEHYFELRKGCEDD